MRNAMADIPNIDQMPWLKFLIRQFVTGTTVPEIIMGLGVKDKQKQELKLLWWGGDIQLWICRNGLKHKSNFN